MEGRLNNSKSPKSNNMKQCSLKDFYSSPLRQLHEYNVQSTGWISKASDSRTSPSKIKTNRPSTKTKSKEKKSKTTLSTPTRNMKGPLEKWIEKKNYNYNGHKQSWKQLQELSKNETPKNRDENQKQKRLLLTKSESFEKYGTILPSADAILKNIDSVKKQDKALEYYERLCQNDDSNPFKDLINVPLSPEKSSNYELLDCKNISLKELKKYFKTHLDVLKNIPKELVYSERHNKYKNPAKKSQLVYNTSTVVFSDEQKEYLLKLLERKLEFSDTEYLFMVLLPEICLRVFMNVHNMTECEANKYLEWRPVE